MAKSSDVAHSERACIRCGATSTPLWRPEVLSGPKVLCNACGVKVLYPVKAKRAKPDSKLTAAAGHQSHLGRTAKEVCDRSASIPSCEQSKSNGARGQESSRLSMPESSKRQKKHSTVEGDVKLSPAQKQYLDVERQYDMSGSKILRWIITDTTIDDTRAFLQVTHAQSFIDECWGFISADFRDKTSPQGSLAARDDLELLLAAAAHAPQEDDEDEGHTPGRHNGRIKLSSEPGPTVHMSVSRSNSPLGHAGALETTAKPAHEAEEGRQLVSLMQRHRSLADVPQPADQLSCPGLPAQAETAVQASAPPQAAPPQAAPPHVAPPPRWPRHSKQTANVTMLHGGGKKSAPKQGPQAAPPTGFAVKSFPTAFASGSFQSTSGPSSIREGPAPHPTLVRQSDHEPAQRPMDFSRAGGQPPRAASREPPAGSSSMPDARRSHSSTKPELPTNKASPARSVSVSPLHLSPPNSQDPCSAQALPQHTHGVDATLQRQLNCQDHAGVSQHDPLGSAQMGCSQKRAPLTAAATDPGSAPQPATARRHRQTASAGLWGHSGDDCIQGVNGRLASQHLPFCWGLRKPRTRYQGSRLSGGTMTDLAVVAAAATAEAEQAAASAIARAHADYDESASQSDAQQQHSQACHPQNELRQTRSGLRSHSLPPRAGPTPQQQPSSSASRGRPGAEAPLAAPRRGAGRKGSGVRTGRNHHRAGALPSNLHKDLGYIGSSFLGVNGVRHGMEFPLRWKAGTWDPVVKKTVYIGSFDDELDAAKAVDAWHVSCGRPPVNFVESEPQLASGHATRSHQHRQGKSCANSGLKWKDQGLAWPPAHESSSDADPCYMEPKSSDDFCMLKPQRSTSVSAWQAAPEEDAQQVAADGLACAPPAASPSWRHLQSAELAVVQSLSLLGGSERRDADHSQHSGVALGMPKRQAAALGCDNNAPEGSSEPAVPLHSRVQADSIDEPRTARNCKGVLFVDGKWRAQIRIDGDMQVIGCFDNKEDAAQAYTLARRQKLLMHVA